MGRSGRAYIAAAAVVLIAAAPKEPKGYWTGPMRGRVPETLAGATVIPEARAALLYLGKHHALAIDVSAAPVRPVVMSPKAVWAPPQHQDMIASVWLPDAGHAVTTPERRAAFTGAVDKLTQGDKRRFVIVYCHPNCWGSWNAAKALVQAGYHHVAWYPGGIEDWSAAGMQLQRTEPTDY